MSATAPGPVIPSRYLEALGDEEPIAALGAGPARVRALLAGLGEGALATPPAPGKWSIKEVIAHLADGEVILGSRMRFVGAHDRPSLPGYDQDAFVARLGVERTTTEALLRSFEMSRGANLELLGRLPPDAFSRIGLHEERGEESIEMMVRMYAGHDRIHEQQIRRIRAAVAGG